MPDASVGTDAAYLMYARPGFAILTLEAAGSGQVSSSRRAAK
jgi:hypothetical protein